MTASRGRMFVTGDIPGRFLREMLFNPGRTPVVFSEEDAACAFEAKHPSSPHPNDRRYCLQSQRRPAGVAVE